MRDVSLAVRPRECLGIVGESGSGKTQVFLAAMGLLPKNARTGGSVRFDGSDILGLAPQALNRVRGSKLTMIFQDPMTSLTPHLKIGVQLARGAGQPPRRFLARRSGAAPLEMLERVRVPEPQRRLRQYPHELSGGMRQRVMIGMSLLCEPDAADRGRADQRARCHRAGANHGFAARLRAELGHGHRADQP